MLSRMLQPMDLKALWRANVRMSGASILLRLQPSHRHPLQIHRIHLVPNDRTSTYCPWSHHCYCRLPQEEKQPINVKRVKLESVKIWILQTYELFLKDFLS